MGWMQKPSTVHCGWGFRLLAQHHTSARRVNGGEPVARVRV